MSLPASSRQPDDGSVTMLDVLNNEKELEEETAAVLGGSDEKNCTYDQGYVKRQALYSCLTCLPECREDASKGAGICLACSYACHENHELVELYTKRNFRCDCGGPRMPKTDCVLDPTKVMPSDRNAYNQNYGGLYCVCHRPYPDPDVSCDDDEMIQCIVCEDWYHSRHLDGELPVPSDFFEMICGQCMTDKPFLLDYTGCCVNRQVERTDATAALTEQPGESKAAEEEAATAKEVVVVDATVTEVQANTSDTSAREDLDQQVLDILKANTSTDTTTTDEPAPKKMRVEVVEPKECRRPATPAHPVKGATFWPNDWRSRLCACDKCMTVYADLAVSYLLDPEDTVQYYEDRGLKKRSDKETDYDRGMRELSSMDRVRQIDAITAYNRMKDRLKEYLNQFVASQQVVTESDIKRFFQEMRTDDRMKEDDQNSHIPYHCR